MKDREHLPIIQDETAVWAGTDSTDMTNQEVRVEAVQAAARFLNGSSASVQILINTASGIEHYIKEGRT